MVPEVGIEPTRLLEAHAGGKTDPSTPNHRRQRCRRTTRCFVYRPIDKTVNKTTQAHAHGNSYSERGNADVRSLVCRACGNGYGTGNPQTDELARVG